MCVWNIWVWSAVIFSMFFMAMSKNEGKLNWNEGELFHQLFVNSVKMLDAPKDLESKSWMLLNWKEMEESSVAIKSESRLSLSF
jgi:hypothetical protein